jgi:guanylate kinase
LKGCDRAAQKSHPEREGILFILSAPSGAGKTSLCKEIVDCFPDLRHSVSFTTRGMRPGERDGVDYHFVSGEEFSRMAEEGAFAEWAEVHGNRYGTALATLEKNRREGIDLLLDIDFQGAAQIRRVYEHGVFIFIFPPSLNELKRRLLDRNTDSPEAIERRIANAREEIQAAAWYDYTIINDDFTLAVKQLKAIITAEQCRTSRVLSAVMKEYEV